MQYTQDDLSAMARTGWGEARGEGTHGLVAVMWSTLNRFIKRPHEFGTSIYDVCHHHEAYSCWDATDPNRQKCIDVSADQGSPHYDAVFALAVQIAYSILEGRIPDPTQGSTHYCVSSLNPKWSIGHTPATVIGHQKFYNDVA